MTCTGFLWRAVIVCAALFSGLLANAQPALPVAKVPTFLGIDLPLRPGERLAPIGKGDCSAVIFAPHDTRFEWHSAFWANVEWVGACRFGLAHGNGSLVLSDGRVVGKQMLYGLESFPAREVATTRQFYGDGSSGDLTLQTRTFYEGPSFSSLNRVQLEIVGYDFIDKVASLADVESMWMWKAHIQKYYFAPDGRELLISVAERNAPCEGDVPAAYKPFLSAVRDVCGRKKSQRLLVLFEGYSDEPIAQHKIVNAVGCPVEKSSGFVECDKVLRKLIGKLSSDFEGIIAGGAASRAAATREVFERFAPLEKALEARLQSGNSAGGMHQ